MFFVTLLSRKNKNDVKKCIFIISFTFRYQDQQYTEPEQAQQQRQSPAYLGPTEEEYRQSQFKQSLGRNSSLRVLKTGKPVVFVGHEE